MIIIRQASESASDRGTGPGGQRTFAKNVLLMSALPAAERVDNQVRHLFW